MSEQLPDITSRDKPAPEWTVAGTADLVRILGRKWTLAIVHTLWQSPLRYGELSRAIPGIAPKVLTESLNGLLADGMVERVICRERLEPKPYVAYGLTLRSCSLADLLEAACCWSEAHFDEATDARSVAHAIDAR